MPLNPLDWTAGPFLGLYIVIVLTAVLFCAYLRSRVGGMPTEPRKPRELDTMQLAFLAGGAQRVADTVIVALFGAKAATLSDDGRKIDVPAAGAKLPPVAQPFVAEVGAGTMTRAELQKRIAGRIDKVKQSLERLGLYPTPSRLSAYRWQVIAIMLVPLLLGINKAFVGVERSKPIGFLVMLLFFTGVAAVMFLYAPQATAAGKEALAASVAQNARAARSPREGELMLAVALTGLVVLSGTAFASMYQAARTDGTTGSGSGDGGCGGGGGGCGGCGG